jgi:formylglycine-generating enzyme required for sulfatase activity
MATTEYCPRCWLDAPGERCADCKTARPSGGWARLPWDFHGIYRFERLLGRGGFGAVFRAVRIRAGKDGEVHAVKVRRQLGADNAAAYARIVEAEQAGVARVVQASRAAGGPLRFVDWHVIDRSLEYIAMEWVSDPTLDVLLERRRLMPAEAARMGASLCQALTVLHSLRMVHCDLKPPNLFVRESDWHVVVGDLGAWVPENTVTRVGADDAGVGAHLLSHYYASPEQMRVERLTPRSDIHAVGSIVWEAVTGTVPFPQAGPRARLAALATVPARHPVIPEPLYTLLAAALAPDPGARPAALELGQMLADLAGWLERSTVAAALRERVQRDAERVEALGDVRALLARARTFEAEALRLPDDQFERERAELASAADRVAAALAALTGVDRAHLADAEAQRDVARGRAAAAAAGVAELERRLAAPRPGSATPWAVALACGCIALVAGVAAVAGWTREIGEPTQGGDAPPAPPTHVARAEYTLLEVPAGDVRLDDPNEAPMTVPVAAFELGATEVTCRLWESVMPAIQGCAAAEPVRGVTLVEVEAFLQRLSQQDGATYRLPTEAEWEHAADRAAAADAATHTDACGYGNVPPDLCDDGYPGLAPVGQFRPSLGFHDLSGNVAEWVDAWYVPYGQAAGATKRVVRGGSFQGIPGVASVQLVSPNFRRGREPGSASEAVGFRIVREAAPPASAATGG